jgi:hypothetical protein
MKTILRIVLCAQLTSSVLLCGAKTSLFDYRVLATSKTSTMEKELNEAADNGYAFSAVMGGQSAFGGKEVIVVMSKKRSGGSPQLRYKLLATSKTSTLEKELQAAGDEGFEYRGQTIFESAFGGKEVSVILEQPKGSGKHHIVYKVLATSKTSTMEKELQGAGDEGFEFLGVVVGKTAMGGSEVVSILKKYTD